MKINVDLITIIGSMPLVVSYHKTLNCIPFLAHHHVLLLNVDIKIKFYQFV
jgi:hypothetical protein